MPSSYIDHSKSLSATRPEALRHSAIESDGIYTPVVATQPVAYSGTPSNYATGTTNATVFTLTAGQRGFIQNLDDEALAVKLGASASTSSFSFILKAGSAEDDGTGGAVWLENYTGVVSVCAMSGTAKYIAWTQA